jgi:hypothetical protein
MGSFVASMIIPGFGLLVLIPHHIEELVFPC